MDKEYKGKIAETPEDAAKDSDFVFTCVGNDNDLKEVSYWKKRNFQHNKKEDSIYIDNTTASAKVARELHKNAEAHGFGFLDAPVSGGQAGAENGALLQLWLVVIKKILIKLKMLLIVIAKKYNC